MNKKIAKQISENQHNINIDEIIEEYQDLNLKNSFFVVTEIMRKECLGRFRGGSTTVRSPINHLANGRIHLNQRRCGVHETYKLYKYVYVLILQTG